jgi:hypothetical protein
MKVDGVLTYMNTEVYVVKAGDQYQLWIKGSCGATPAGPRLLKSQYPPDFKFTHTVAKDAYEEAERLGLYLEKQK